MRSVLVKRSVMCHRKSVGPTTGQEEPEVKSPPLAIIGDSLYHLIYYKLLFSIQSFPNPKLYIHSLRNSFQSGIRNPMWVLQEGLKKTRNLFHFLSHTRTEPHFILTWVLFKKILWNGCPCSFMCPFRGPSCE